MYRTKLPPEEDVVRAINEAHWDPPKNRWSKSLFYTRNASVSRLKVLPLKRLCKIFQQDFPTLLKVGEINVGVLEHLGKTHPTPQDIVVVADPKPENEAHAEIPGRFSKGLAQRVVENLKIHDIPEDL
jgi:hypothetical protein